MRIRGLPIEERLKLYNEAIKLRKLGYGSWRISRILGISSSTVDKWLYYGKNPIRRPFPYYSLKPSPSLAYVIGVLTGDGTLTYTSSKHGDKKRRYRALHILKVKDFDFAKTFSEELGKALGRPPPPIKIADKKYYRIMFHSVELSKVLSDMNLLKAYVDQYPEAFIKGFFDAEGCVTLKRSTMRNSRLEIANTNLELLKYVQELLAKFGIHSKIRRIHDTRLTRKPCYELYILRKRSILLFAEKIGCSVERKKRKLDKLVSWILTHGNEKMWR